MRVVGELCSPARDFRRLLPHCFWRNGRELEEIAPDKALTEPEKRRQASGSR
jgi:hypothetical protein